MSYSQMHVVILYLPMSYSQMHVVILILDVPNQVDSHVSSQVHLLLNVLGR